MDAAQQAYVTASAAKVRASTSDPLEIIARAEAASREGRVVDARRLNDEAMNRLEMKHHTRAHLIPTTRESAEAFPDDYHAFATLSIGPANKWIAMGRTLVEPRTGRIVTLPGNGEIHFSPDDHWVATAITLGTGIEPALVVRELSSGVVLGPFAGDPSKIQFGSLSKHLTATLTRGEQATANPPSSSSVLVVVDLTRRSSYEIPTGGGEADIDRSDRFAVWADPKALQVLELDTRNVKTTVLTEAPAGSIVRGTYAFTDPHTTGFELVAVDVESGAEVLRKKLERKIFRNTDTGQSPIALISRDGNHVVWWSGRDEQLVVRDFSRGEKADKKISPRYRRCSGYAEPTYFSSVDKGRIIGKACLDDSLEIDVVTGKTLALQHGGGFSVPDQEYFLNERIQAELYKGEKACESVGGLRCSTLFQWQHEANSAHLMTVGDGSYSHRWEDTGLLVLPTKSGAVLVDPNPSHERPVVKLAESQLIEIETEKRTLISRGELLVGSDATSRVRVWDIRSGAVLWRAPTQPEPAVAASFTTNGDLVTLSPIGTLRRFNMTTGKLVSTWMVPSGFGCRPIAFGGGDAGVVVCDDGNERRVFCGGNDTPITTLPAPHGSARGLLVVALDPDARRIAISGVARNEDQSTDLVIAPFSALGADRMSVISKAEATIHGFGFSFALAGDWVGSNPSVWSIKNTKTTFSVSERGYAGGVPGMSRDGSWAAFGRPEGVRVIHLSSAEVAAANAAPGTDAGTAKIDGDASTKPREVFFSSGPVKLDTESPVVVDGNVGVFAKSKDSLVAWTFDEPSTPRLIKPYRPVLAVSPKDGKVILGGHGVLITTMSDLVNGRALLAVPQANEALTIDSPTSSHPEPAPIYSGALGIISTTNELGRCVIGPSIVALDVCLGRFAD